MLENDPNDSLNNMALDKCKASRDGYATHTLRHLL